MVNLSLPLSLGISIDLLWGEVWIFSELHSFYLVVILAMLTVSFPPTFTTTW